MKKHVITIRVLVNTLILISLFVSQYARAETSNFASLTAGLDNENGSLFDAYVDMSLTEILRISLSAGENTSDTNEGKFTTRQIQTSISGLHTNKNQSAMAWSIGYRTWGKSNVIETEDSIISIGYFSPDNWHLSLDYETGQLQLYTRGEFSKRQKSLKSNRDAWRLSFDHTHNGGFAWMSYLQRNYAQNLSLLNERRNAQRAINNIALNQAFALSKEELTLGYEWFLETLDLGVDYNRIISVVDNHRNHYASIFTRHYVGNNLTVDLRIEQEINDRFTVFTVGVGYAW